MSKSSDYWEKRQREREAKVFKTSKEAEKALEIELLQAKEEILSKTNNLINTYMSETEMSYAKAVRTLKGKEYRVWQKDIEGYLKDLKKYKKVNPEKYKEVKLELETLATRSRVTRLEALKTQIDNELNKKSFEDEKEIKKYVSSVYQSSFESIQTDIGITGVNTILPIEKIEKLIQYPWSGENFSERIWNNRDDLSKTLKSEITQAFIQGINPKEIIKRVESRMGSSHKNTVRLVRTELNYAMNQATKRAYEDDDIEEYEFLAEIDDRTSAICKELHRQRFKTKDAKVGVNYPPMHPHCRSTTTPVIDYESIGKNNPVKERENNDIIEENRRLLSTEEIIEEAQKFAKELEKNPELLRYDNGEEYSNYLNKKLGYDALPKVVSKEEFEKLSKGKVVLYRGVADMGDLKATDMVKQFKYGKFFAGSGAYGNGSYADPEKREAEYYAYDTADGNGKIMKMILKDNAKVVSYMDILTEYDKTGIKREIILKKKREVEEYKNILGDVANYASIKGYDAIALNGFHGKEHYVILNRGKVIIEK